MTLKDDLDIAVKEIVDTELSISFAQQVPTTGSFNLSNQGKYLTGTYMYVDLANSTSLAAYHTFEVTAKVIKCFLSVVSKILRHYNGEIRSFDGDRAMAIFIGDDSCDRAVEAAWKIHWAVAKIAYEYVYISEDEIFESKWKMEAGIGIDTGDALIVRGGIRNHNDLVSIGDPPNIAAKLSEIREGSPRTYITNDVWDALRYSLCYTDDHKPKWSDPQSRDLGGRTENVCVSTYWWEV